MKTGKVWQAAAGVVLLCVFTSACKKHVPAPPPPPPPPPPAAPSASLTVEPADIQQGQSATLRWSSQNATGASIEPDIGSVDVQGSRTVSPSDSTTYTLNVTGSGGTAQATARLTVTAPPPPPPPPPPAPQVSLQDQFNQAVKDAFFDFDKSDIRGDARDNLTQSAQFLTQHPDVTITIEGHCDERGSTAYNLGLGDRRANAARDFLVSQGVSTDRIKTISYGKEKPFCTDHDESCWQQNRRAHLVCNNCSQ